MSGIEDTIAQLTSMTPPDGAKAMIEAHAEKHKEPFAAQRAAEAYAWKLWERVAGGGPFNRADDKNPTALHLIETIRCIAFPELRKLAV